MLAKNIIVTATAFILFLVITFLGWVVVFTPSFFVFLIMGGVSQDFVTSAYNPFLTIFFIIPFALWYQLKKDNPSYKKTIFFLSLMTFHLIKYAVVLDAYKFLKEYMDISLFGLIISFFISVIKFSIIYFIFNQLYSWLFLIVGKLENIMSKSTEKTPKQQVEQGETNESELLAIQKTLDPKTLQTLQRAEQGDAYAQFNLGLMYQQGQGVTQDTQKAIYWFKKSAEQGNNYAKKQLATYGIYV